MKPMRPIRCKLCTRWFERSVPQQKYCSAECKKPQTLSKNGKPHESFLVRGKISSANGIRYK